MMHDSRETAPHEPVGPTHVLGLLGGPAALVLAFVVPAPSGMAPEAWMMAGIAAWMVIWWLSEAVPIPATALLPLVLMPLTGVLELQPTAARYANPIIFLFLGGFLLAAAMQRAGLHRRVALRIIDMVGTTPDRIILGFMLATGFLSMWISNTATAVMMYAVGISVIDFVSEKTDDDRVIRNFGVALMLAIAYAANIGGIGTLIGTPPNALLASYLQESHGIEISFARWMLLGVPIVVLMLPATWLVLTRVLFPSGSIAIDDPKGMVATELGKLGRMSRGETVVGTVFLVTALLWIFRTPLTNLTGLALDDAIIAIGAALVLFAIPISPSKGQFALDWDSARDIPWGVLILFGGGLALAQGFGESGLAQWIGNAVGGIEVSTWILIAIVTIVMVYLTETTSNTASTATFLPILGAVAVGLSLDPMVLTVPVALAASLAFMMPVATPPNAIVFSYERMQLGDMVRAGFLLNLIGIAVIVALFLTIGPVVFGLSLSAQ